MANNVIILRTTAADILDSLNRNVVCETDDIENGGVFVLNTYSDKADEKMVWKAEKPSATSTGIWMAYSPELTVVTDAMGNHYAGLTKDPRAFTNVKGKVFDAFALFDKDVIEMTGANIAGIDTNAYLNVGTDFKLVASGSASESGAYLKKVGTNTLKIPTGSIGGDKVKTYIYEVVRH